MIGYGTFYAYAGQQVGFTGKGTMGVTNYDAAFTGKGTLTAKASVPARAGFTGKGTLYAIASEIDRCSSSLPALMSICGDAENWSFMSSSLPAMQSQAVEEVYVPAFVSSCASVLPALQSLAISDQQNLGYVSSSLEPLVSLCADYDYGICQSSLPAMSSLCYGGSRLEINAMSHLFAVGETSLKCDLVLIVNSTGTLVGSTTLSRVMVLSALSSLLATGTTSVVSFFNLSAMSSCTAVSLAMLQSGTMPVTDPVTRVWVVNLDTHASSQYDDYGFVSFFNANGKSYGVAKDGIYELEGDTDAGNHIDALIDFGRTDFGSSQKKQVPHFYLGVGSAGKMLLKVEADNQTYIYEALSSSENIENHRVDIGKGLIGNYWNPVLMNQDGCDFDLETIAFEPIPLSRKI